MPTMEFNRVVSLVLGFIVLILAFVWISNKFRAKNSTTQTNQTTVTITPTILEENEKWNPLSFLFDNKTQTPTPTKSSNAIKITSGDVLTPTPQIRISIIEGKNNPEKSASSEQTTIITKNTNIVYNKKPVQQIPETGSPTVLIPILSLLIAGGFAIKKAR